jgi:hypothetical protein
MWATLGRETGDGREGRRTSSGGEVGRASEGRGRRKDGRRWVLGWRDGRRESQREGGEAAAATATAAAGDDEAQGRRQHAVRLIFKLVRSNALARGRIEAGEDDP